MTTTHSNVLKDTFFQTPVLLQTPRLLDLDTFCKSLLLQQKILYNAYMIHLGSNNHFCDKLEKVNGIYS